LWRCFLKVELELWTFVPPPLLLPLFTTTPLISGLLASWPTLFSITALVTSRRWSLG